MDGYYKNQVLTSYGLIKDFITGSYLNDWTLLFCCVSSMNRKRPLCMVKFRYLIQIKTKETRSLSMDILNTVSLESNSQIKINFDGGDLSSNADLSPW